MTDGVLSAVNPDLRPFFARGGKLIHYHGWTDQQVMPRDSIHYLKKVVAADGEKSTDSYRLFLVPGMNHCRGGDGPNSFDMLGALEQWREYGKAPDAIVASIQLMGKSIGHDHCARIRRLVSTKEQEARTTRRTSRAPLLSADWSLRLHLRCGAGGEPFSACGCN